MALTSAWMPACDIDGVKTQTYGPNVAVTASGQRLAGDGSARACSAPTAVAVSAAAPKSAALTTRRAILCIRHLTVLEFPRKRTTQGGASEDQTLNQTVKKL